MRRGENPDNAPEKQREYKVRLESLSDADLFKETRDKVWFSAYASNNPISCYHWQCTATYNEWDRRGKVDRYGDAHSAVMRECGY